jgi:hypothetical protein
MEATVAARTIAVGPRPSRAMNRLASREPADAAATTWVESFSSAQVTAASMRDRPAPCRRNLSRTWRCST